MLLLKLGDCQQSERKVVVDRANLDHLCDWGGVVAQSWRRGVEGRVWARILHGKGGTACVSDWCDVLFVEKVGGRVVVVPEKSRLRFDCADCEGCF